jgi:hypothetical protein
MSRILWDATYTARKHHECSSCGRAINPGENYRRAWVVGFDESFTYKECAHCQAFVAFYLKEFCPDYDGDGWYPSDVEGWEPETDAAREHRRRFLIGWRHGRDLYPVPGQEPSGVTTVVSAIVGLK